MSVQDYMKRPYNIVIKPIADESGSYYHAFVLELDGCQSTGDTYQEAYDSLMEAMEVWIEINFSMNLPIPDPICTDRYSGKFVIRLPKSLHARLALEAKSEGVSLNQYALYKLSH